MNRINACREIEIPGMPHVGGDEPAATPSRLFREMGDAE